MFFPDQVTFVTYPLRTHTNTSNSELFLAFYFCHLGGQPVHHRAFPRYLVNRLRAQGFHRPKPLHVAQHTAR